MVEGFADDRERLARTLRGTGVGGGTALYDALALSLRHVLAGRHTKKAILLISDGEDTGSAVSFEEAQRDVRESEVLIYSLGIAADQNSVVSGRSRPPLPVPPGISFPLPIPVAGSSPPTFPTGDDTGRRPSDPSPLGTVDMEVLSRFGEISGGRAWLVSDDTDEGRRNEIDDALLELVEELRSQYSIGYYPEHLLQDGNWHLIAVEANQPNHRVRHRRNYFGGSGDPLTPR